VSCMGGDDAFVTERGLARAIAVGGPSRQLVHGCHILHTEFRGAEREGGGRQGSLSC